MQATGDGRQAGGQPNNGASRASRGAGSLAVALPMLLFAAMAIVALFGFVAVVGVFALYSQGLQPATGLETIQFSSQSTIYDRAGTVQLATFGGGQNRAPVTYDQI